jgi:hypothetical protein
VEVVASLTQGRTAAAQYGFFTHKSVPVIFEPPCRCLLKVLRPVRKPVRTLDCVLLKDSNRAFVPGLWPGPHIEEFVLAI